MKTTVYFFKSVAVICCLCSTFAAVAHEHDTLKCHFSDTSVFTYMLYKVGAGGYLCGNNAYSDLEIAQKFGQAPPGDTVGTECSVPDQHQLNDVLVYFGAKKVADANDTAYVNVYSVNHTTGGPDVLLGTSYPVKMNYIDTSAVAPVYTDFLLQLPVIFTDSFFVSVVFPHEAGDTVGIVSNAYGQAQGTRLCWRKNSGGLWSSLYASDSADIDAVIMPSVGDEPEGIAEVSHPVVQANAFPNPAHGNTVIDYTLSKPVPQLKFSLIDISGKVVYSLPLDNNMAGEHTLSVDINGFPTGSYFYSFESGGKKFNGIIEIVK